MRRRDWLLNGIGTATVAAGLGCARRAASGRRKLTLSASRQLSMSSLFLSLESGYFRDAGFDVEIVPTESPLHAMAAMAGGTLDIALTSLGTYLLNAVLKGIPIKIVAGREIASPACGIAGVIFGLRRTFPGGLSDLRVLRGKRISAGPAMGFSYFALDAQLETAGLTLNDVTPIMLSQAQGVAALVGGSIDAMVLNREPDFELATLSSELVRTDGLARVYPNFQYSHIFFGPTLLQADVKVGGRFLAAYLRGAREFAAGRTPRYMEEFARSHGLDVQHVVTSCRNTYALDGKVDMDSLRLYAEWALRRKYTPRLVDIRQLVDSRFLEASDAD